MPKGIKVIIGLNLLFAVLFIGDVVFMHKTVQGAPILLFVNLLCASSLILITLIVLLRQSWLIGFARVLAYVVILILGLHFLLMLKYLMSKVAITLLIDLVVLFYAIGMRGYLISSEAENYFRRKRD